MGLPESNLTDCYFRVLDEICHFWFKKTSGELLSKLTLSNSHFDVFIEVNLDCAVSGGMSVMVGNLKKKSWEKKEYEFFTYGGGFSVGVAHISGALGVAGSKGFAGRKNALRLDGSVGAGHVNFSATLILAFDLVDLPFDTSKPLDLQLVAKFVETVVS